MTQDEIIRFAIQCRLVTTGNSDGIYMDALTEFANLVATKEREACAKLVDEEALDAYTFDDSLARATEGYARLIRARGEQA
jgi:hypothetical protein